MRFPLVLRNLAVFSALMSNYGYTKVQALAALHHADCDVVHLRRGAKEVRFSQAIGIVSDVCCFEISGRSLPRFKANPHRASRFGTKVRSECYLNMMLLFATE